VQTVDYLWRHGDAGGSEIQEGRFAVAPGGGEVGDSSLLNKFYS